MKYLGFLTVFLSAITYLFKRLYMPPTQPIPSPEPTTTPPEALKQPQVETSTPEPYQWDIPSHARHSVRVICDEEGLTYETTVIDGKKYKVKDVICAVIMGESEFYNDAKNYNRNTKGEITSTDWGICQINDRYHIGKGKDFPSVEYLLDHPEKAVRFMIDMWRAGNIHLWIAWLNGSYKQYLPKPLA